VNLAEPSVTIPRQLGHRENGHVDVAANHQRRRRPAEQYPSAAGAGGDTDRSRTRLLRGAAGTSYGDFARTRWRSRCAARRRDSYPARPLGSTRRAHRQGDQHSRSGRHSVRARRLLDPERCGAASRRRSAVCTGGRATPQNGLEDIRRAGLRAGCDRPSLTLPFRPVSARRDRRFFFGGGAGPFERGVVVSEVLRVSRKISSRAPSTVFDFLFRVSGLAPCPSR
jgi:hypothetical protein